MYGRSAIWFPLVLLALLAALTLWIDRTVQPVQPKRDGSSRHDMDYKVNNFTTTRTDQDGNPRHVLSAVELLHFPDDDSTELTRPRFTQYAANKPYTQIQGLRGKVSSSGEDVYFMGHVQVVRAATSGRGELTVLTEYLHLMPEKEIAVTDRPVSILQAPHTVLRGTGMVFNKKERTLQLSGRVHVHYERERPGADVRPKKAPPPLKVSSAARKPQDVPQVLAHDQVAQPLAAVQHPIKKKSAHSAAKRQPKTGKTTTRIRRQYEKSAH